MNAAGWDIGFFHQPANSPDCNTLDLAFFRAIQSLQYQKCPKNIDELIAHVHEAFDELPLDICCKVWTTAKIVMNQIILRNGNNDYKLQNIGKLKIDHELQFVNINPSCSNIGSHQYPDTGLLEFI